MGRPPLAPHRPLPEARIAAMFDDIVDRYEVLNDLLSMGLIRRWRRATADSIRVRPGSVVLDLGCGTGDLGSLLAGRARVVGIDVSRGMLLRARGKAGGGLKLVRGSAFRLPFADGALAGAVSGFVLRNLDDLSAAFAELARVLGPGATAAIVDVAEPPNPILRLGFDAYFRTVAPALGRLVGKRDAYDYLVRSLSHLPPAEEIRSMLLAAGFVRATYRRLSGGIATVFEAQTGERGAGAPP